MADPARRGADRARRHARLIEVRGVFVDPRPFEGEHSLEMHLVMLQAMLPRPFEILPLLIGDADPMSVADAQGRVWADRRRWSRSPPTSRISSTREARRRSIPAPRLIETLDAPPLDGRRARGFLALKAALAVAAERDMRATGLSQATSAEAGAGCSRVVGYSALALEHAASARLAETDRDHPLSASTAALGVAARSEGNAPAPSLGDDASPALSSWHATFVTLTENGRLRGCIGTLSPHRPLMEDAPANTAKAGFTDPRFPPLKESDLTGLRLDVSMLSHPRPLHAASEPELAAALEPDRDGSFSPPASVVRCSCRASGTCYRTRTRPLGRRGWRRSASASNCSARHGGGSIWGT